MRYTTENDYVETLGNENQNDYEDSLARAVHRLGGRTHIRLSVEHDGDDFAGSLRNSLNLLRVYYRDEKPLESGVCLDISRFDVQYRELSGNDLEDT